MAFSMRKVLQSNWTKFIAADLILATFAWRHAANSRFQRQEDKRSTFYKLSKTKKLSRHILDDE